MEKEEQFGAFRLKYKTIAALKKLKLATEGSLGHELTNDEFMEILVFKATGEKKCKACPSGT